MVAGFVAAALGAAVVAISCRQVRPVDVAAPGTPACAHLHGNPIATACAGLLGAPIALAALGFALCTASPAATTPANPL